MQQAKRGDTVQVHYRGTLDDGTEFDSSAGRDPLEFTIGEGQVIPGFEEAVVGMATGDTKKQRIEAKDAYGEHSDELVFAVSRGRIPEGTEVAVGDTLRIGFGDGQTAAVQVTELDADTITLDANHPLAGEALTFELELVAIQ
jgi:peptidylprolyl isomerase